MSDPWVPPVAGDAPPPPGVEGGSFPLGSSADFSEVFTYAMARWRENLVPLSAVAILFFLVVLAASFASSFVSQVLGVAIAASGAEDAVMASAVLGQIVGMGINTLATASVIGGVYRCVADALLGRPVEVSRILLPGDVFAQVILAQVAITMVSTLVMVVWAVPVVGVMVGTGLPFSLETVIQAPPALLAAAMVGGVGAVGVALILLPVSAFSIVEVVVGRCGAFEGMARAWQIGNGHRLRTFGYLVVSSFLAFIGVFACCVGVIPLAALGWALQLALFLLLRAQSGVPAMAAY